MKCYAKSLVWIGLIALLKCQVANAAVHNITQGQLPICNNWNNSWSISGSTYTCSASVSFVAGDEYVANSPITLRADAGITLSANKVGSVASPVALQTAYGTLNASAGSSVVYGNLTTGSGSLVLAGVSLIGNVKTSGAVSIDNSTLSGTVNGSGQGTIRNSSVSGAVAFNNGLTSANAVFSSTLTSTNGSVNLSGGSVAGLINVACCKVTISQGAVISKGIVAGSNGIDIRDSSVAGDLKAGNNPIVMVNVNMTSGTISPGNNSLTITGGTVTADVTNAHRVFISNNALVTGDVLARYEVSVSDSKVVGDIGTVVGHDGLHHVYLANSEIYGNVTVRDDWGTINGDNASRIYGVCTYKDVNPVSLCESGGGPGPIDPDDPIECGVSLKVGPMIAGKPHSATLIALDEPLSCEVPSLLNILFNYQDRDPDYHNPVSIWIDGKEIKEGRSEEFSDVPWSGKEAKLDIKYEEAGKLYLAVLGADDEVLADEYFVSRPYGFCIKPLKVAPILGGELLENIDFDMPHVFKAGDPLLVSVRAVRWSKGNGESYGLPDSPLLAKDVCDNFPTENYRQASPTYFAETPKLIQPKLGESGKAEGDFKHLSIDNNFEPGVAVANLILTEVGFFRVQIENPPQYLGVDMSGSISESDIIGRIIPAYFSLEDPEVVQGCGSFTYAGLQKKSEPKKGQPFSVRGKLYARNRDGEVTQNYKDSFFRLAEKSLRFRDSREIKNKIEFYESDHFEGGVDEQDDRYFDYARSLQFSFETPTMPYKLALQVSLKDLDEVEGGVVDEGKDAEGNVDDGFLPEFRLGIARLSNAHGSELKNLPLDFTTAYFDGSSYVLNGQDNCSVLAYSSELDLVNLNGDLESYTEIVNRNSPLLVAKGKEQIVLKAPTDGKTGSVEVMPTLEGTEWLKYEWEGDDELKAPTGLATFGIYKGPKPLIFRREVYRN